MKRNLLAVFLAVMVLSALVFFVAPSAKAADSNVVQATGASLPEGFDFDANILDLNGNNVEVTVPGGKTLRVIDTANKKEDNKVGTLTNDGAGDIANVTQDPSSKMQFVAIATTAENVTTYQFHPFNLTISKVGINTIANDSSTEDETDTTVAICLRGTYGANNAVLASDVISDYGLCTVKLVDDKYEYGTPVSAKNAYTFDKKLMHAYFDLANLLDTNNIDSTFYYCTYMVVNGETVYSSNVEITPRDVLKKINSSNATPTDAQLGRIQTLMRSNTRVNNILSCFRAVTLSFEDTAQRTVFTTEQQVWEQNGITLTNNKSSSTTNVADYAPARFYKNSEIIVSYPGMTKIVFNCVSSYADMGLPNDAGYTVTTNGTITTVEFSSPVDTFTATMASGQVRMTSIEVPLNFPDCTHEKHSATCTAVGSCLDCNEVISALGHAYVDGICTICGGSESTTDPENPGTVDHSWIKTDLGNIKSTDIVVIVWTKDSTSYAMSNDKGTSSAPTAVVVTVVGNTLTGDIADNIKWNITNSNEGLTIYPNGTTETWLYCTSSNNGVRVGTNTSKTFTIDSASGYLKHSGTNRYLGVYTTNPDVRCYTSSTATNIANQTLAFYVRTSGTAGGETPDTPACEHTNTTTTVDATCTAAGSKTVTCDDCGETLSTEEIAALGHTTENGVCDNCGETIGGSTTPSEPKILATFALGANGSASHSDGTSKTSYSETNNGYTLNLTSGTNMYTGARDAKGNSCIKLGASSKVGSFAFTVPENVTKVVIYIAKYKANTTKISVNNGTPQTLTKSSNDGAYDVITIDTTTNKTITLETQSGGYRAMMNTIEFHGYA